MNRNVEQCPDEAVSAAIRAIAARAQRRIRRWFGGSGLEQANRETIVSVHARELHDSVLRRGVQGACMLARTGLDRLPEALRSSIAASRSLEEAISEFGGELLPGKHIRYQVLVSGQSKPLKPEVQEQLCHIAREALVNALRHARATRIETEICYLPRQLRVMVRDNGCGIDPEVIGLGRRASLGLRGMCERAESIGAQLHIWSGPRAGTEVEVTARGAVLDGLSVT